MDGGETLSDEGVTLVVRVGDTVRRPVRPFTATVQRFLAYLHEAGFDAAPVPLGYDDAGREVLSFVAGVVPVDPLPEWAYADDVIVELARLIRRLHDVAAEWRPPADAVYGHVPGKTPAGVIPLFDRPELVSHQDYCPGNVVFADGLPTAFIDFDLARPTTRVADLVNAMHWWVPLTSPQDRPPLDVARRVRLCADAYGLNAAQRAQVVPTAVRRARNVVLTMGAAAEADPVFRRWWDSGLRELLPRTRDWLIDEAPAIEAALR